jgi:hypothetical protein
MPDEPINPTPEDRHVSRLELVSNVVAFQFKLALDGIRDILLVPLSIFSAILGLVAGGGEPDRYYKQLLRFGRRTEAWLNLFGHRRHGETSDKLIRPLQEKVLDGAQSNAWLNKAGSQINRGLDNVNASVTNATAAVKGSKEDSER